MCDRPVTRASSSSAPAAFDFVAEFRRFLADEINRQLLRDIIVAPLTDEIQALKTTIDEKDDEITGLREQLAVMKDQLAEVEQKNDDLEQYTRRNSLRISGLPEEPNENCYGKALSLANSTLKLDPPLSLSDIDRTHRVGRPRPGQSRGLLVKFATYQQRHRVMRARHVLKNTAVFINEDLTSKRATLLWKARSAKREGRIKDAWSSDGRINIRDLRDVVRVIKSCDELIEVTTVPPDQSSTETPS